jgi:hypothetical protein
MKYLKEHEDFLRKHETTPRKELTKLFNDKFKTEVTHKALGQKCINIGLSCPNNGCFKKGSIPVNKGTKGLTKRNKTSFGFGNRPMNAKKVGSVVTRKDKNGSLYMRIKIAEPNKWQMLHELARLNQKYAHIDKSLKETALQVIKLSKEIRKVKR